MENREKFEEFMICEGAWNIFLFNLKQDIDTYFSETDPCDYLASAFVFADTADGYKFWDELQSKWDKYLL